MGYAGQKAVSKVNMILKDKSCSLPKLKLGNPLKKVDKMGQRIIKQGEKAEAAKLSGNEKKATRHTNRATRMNERDMKKKNKQNARGPQKRGCKY